jgi:hypothetical protein
MLFSERIIGLCRDTVIDYSHAAPLASLPPSAFGRVYDAEA